MKNSSILEKYKLFNITKDNQPKFQPSSNFSSNNKYNKCSVLEETNIRYYNSTKNLKKN